MRTAIFAALLAFCAATVVPAQAASITITTDNGARYDDGPRYRFESGHRGWERGHHRGWYKKHRREARRDCDVRVERYWRHGRLIIERSRDCR